MELLGTKRCLESSLKKLLQSVSFQRAFLGYMFLDSCNLLPTFVAEFLRDTSRLSPEVSVETLQKTEPDLLVMPLLPLRCPRPVSEAEGITGDIVNPRLSYLFVRPRLLT